jgi:TPR repeat protein
MGFPLRRGAVAMMRLVLTLFLIVLQAGPVWASRAKAWAAYARGDYETALQEFLPLAEQGTPSVHFALGFVYEHVKGAPQNDVEAVKWYRRAAEQGHGEAQHNLGIMYANGRGVARDDAEAVAWYRKAAEQDIAKALVNLGSMYMRGRGVPQDPILAHMWLSVAIDRMEPGQDRDKAAEARNLVAESMTPLQIKKAKLRARNWTPKAP